MMKGFLKISKLMGLMLLASGLIFAGCSGPGSDSENAVSGKSGFMIPIAVDTASDTLKIGDGAGMAVASFDGHSVGVSNAAACTGVDDFHAVCSIRITNLDPTHYMANTYIVLSYCNSCTGDKVFLNADLSDGNTVAAPGDPDGGGATADINGAAFCVVEDGMYEADGIVSPYNATGCQAVWTKGDYKPLQFIHPDCGTRDVEWDFFTGSGDQFLFYANISAEWYPEIPLADGRFDWEDKTTMYLTLNSLNDDMIFGAVNKLWWRLGSSQRSSVLTGYGSGGADFTPATGRYFALNVAAEYPDRVEKRTGAGFADSTGLFEPYEYVQNFAWVIRYDPTVVRAVTASAAVKKGGTVVRAGGNDQCDRELGFCSVQNIPTATGFDGISTTTNFGGVPETQGWLYSYNPISIGTFAWNLSGQFYKTTAGDDIKGGSADIWPIHAGVHGLVKPSMVPYPGSPNTIWYASTGLVANGTPDPDPEIGLGLYYFKTIGASGTGTQIYADQYVIESGPLWYWTGNTAAGGFAGAASDDWVNFCYPIQPGYEGNDGCNDAIGFAPYTIFHTIEVPNQNIRHSGSIMFGGGAIQYWNVHVCVL